MRAQQNKRQHFKVKRKVLILIGVILLVAIVGTILYLRTYLPTHTKSYFTDFKQYAPSFIPGGHSLTRGEIMVAPRSSNPGEYNKVLQFSAGSSMNFEEEKDGAVLAKSYRASCSSIPKGFVDACNDATSPGGQKYVYTDYSFSLGTPIIIVSWRKNDTYMSITSTNPKIASGEYAKIIDSMKPTMFTKAAINDL